MTAKVYKGRCVGECVYIQCDITRRVCTPARTYYTNAI